MITRIERAIAKMRLLLFCGMARKLVLHQWGAALARRGVNVGNGLADLVLQRDEILGQRCGLREDYIIMVWAPGKRRPAPKGFFQAAADAVAEHGVAEL